MPLDVTPQFIAHLAEDVTRLATCIKLDLVDGSNQSYTWTSFDKQILYAGDNYNPLAGYVPSAQVAKIDLAVDNMTITNIIDQDEITRADLLSGRLDNANVRIFFVVYTNPDAFGDLVLINGKVGQVVVYDNTFVLELRSLTQFLQTNVCTPYIIECPTVFGDNKCKVKVDPPIWQASTQYTVDSINSVVKASVYNERRFVVTSATGAMLSGAVEPAWDLTIGNTTVDNDLVWTAQDALTKNFSITGKSVAAPKRIFETNLLDVDDHFELGKVQFTSGNNRFFKMDVKSYQQNLGTVELYEPMYFDMALGDNGTISTGCDKKWNTCKNRYGNRNNYRGFLYLTGLLKLLRGQ